MLQVTIDDKKRLMPISCLMISVRSGCLRVSRVRGFTVVDFGRCCFCTCTVKSATGFNKYSTSGAPLSYKINVNF